MEEYLSLLERLIATPSFSREEEGTASILEDFLSSRQIADVHRDANNVWAACAHFDASKPTLLLNSHHDTVRPSASYTRNPFLPTTLFSLFQQKKKSLERTASGACCPHFR